LIYVDSSGLVKLVVLERETGALRAWLADKPIVSSELARIEVIRAARRISAAAVPVARAMLTGIDYVPLNRGVIDQAAELGNPLLRSLDAIHLVSALLVTDLTGFVAYDHRLVAAASSVGLAAVSPT
jgi:predicted nucleic acid-binding protein